MERWRRKEGWKAWWTHLKALWVFFNKQQTVKLLSNQSLWVMRGRYRERDRGWRDNETHYPPTNFHHCPVSNLSLLSCRGLKQSTALRWQMKTNYTNCFVNLKADSLPSPRTYTDNPVGTGNYSLLTGLKHTSVYDCFCVTVALIISIVKAFCV